MKKIYLAIIAASLFTGLMFGQTQDTVKSKNEKKEKVYATPTQNRHEISITANGGLATFMPHSHYIKNTLGFGGHLGLAYDYYITYNWSIGIGAEFSAINLWLGKQSLSNFDDYYDYFVRGGQNEYMRFRTEALEDYEYFQRTQGFYVNIPIIARYGFDISKAGHRLQTGFGLKIGVPINAMSNYVTNGALRLSGVELDANSQPITRDWYGADLEDAESFGSILFGKNTFDNVKNKLPLNINLIGTVDIGVKWKIAKVFQIYTGLYLDYGFMDVNKSKARLFAIDENFAANPTEFTPTPIFGSQFGAEGNRLNVDKAHNLSKFTNTISAGLKVTFTFGWCPMEDTKKAEKLRKQEETAAAAAKANEKPAEKPYEGLTEDQMRKIMQENIDEVNKANKKELDEIKELLKTKEIEPLGDIHGYTVAGYYVEPEMEASLNKVVTYMQQNKDVEMLFVGYTCDIGSDVINQKLGLNRANFAKDYLVRKGIDSKRIYVDSKGSASPLVSNSNEDGRLRNRRVEFIPLNLTK